MLSHITGLWETLACFICRLTQTPITLNNQRRRYERPKRDISISHSPTYPAWAQTHTGCSSHLFTRHPREKPPSLQHHHFKLIRIEQDWCRFRGEVKWRSGPHSVNCSLCAETGSLKETPEGSLDVCKTQWCTMELAAVPVIKLQLKAQLALHERKTLLSSVVSTL